MNLRFVAFIIICTRFHLEGLAQEYRHVRFAFGGGQSSKGGSEIFFLEPSFRFNRKIMIGFRNELFIPYDSRSTLSTSVNLQYYLPLYKGIMPFHQMYFFVGFGISGNNKIITQAPYTAKFANGTLQNIFPQETDGTLVPGFYPRFGFDYRHFTFNFEYNFVQKLKVTLDHYSAQTAQFIGYSSTFVNNNYLGVKLGCYIGGGSKKSKI